MTNKLTKNKLDALVIGWLGEGALPAGAAVPGATPKLVEFLKGGKVTPSPGAPPAEATPERKRRYPFVR